MPVPCQAPVLQAGGPGSFYVAWSLLTPIVSILLEPQCLQVLLGIFCIWSSYEQDGQKRELAEVLGTRLWVVKEEMDLLPSVRAGHVALPSSKV
jgi:hypothetical protein